MDRPSWCPHQSCGFVCKSQDLICVGMLPMPEPHDGVDNTHRLCLRGAKDDGEWTFDLQINRGDAWNLTRMLRAIFPSLADGVIERCAVAAESESLSEEDIAHDRLAHGHAKEDEAYNMAIRHAAAAIRALKGNTH